MSPSWYNDIDLWFKKYGFDEDVMVLLFEYCLGRSALHRNYVQAVAENWSKSNIKTSTDLESYYQKYEKMSKIKKTIHKKLGRYDPFTQFEEEYIEKWVVDFGYDMTIINIALKKTTSKATPTFDYLDKLLSSWNERKLKTVSEIESFMLQIKEKNKNVKQMEKSTNYNNYKQVPHTNLNELYSNKKTQKGAI